eukprot:1353547-Rhodomonas_salina.2
MPDPNQSPVFGTSSGWCTRLVPGMLNVWNAGFKYIRPMSAFRAGGCAIECCMFAGPMDRIAAKTVPMLGLESEALGASDTCKGTSACSSSGSALSNIPGLPGTKHGNEKHGIGSKYYTQLGKMTIGSLAKAA